MLRGTCTGTTAAPTHVNTRDSPVGPRAQLCVAQVERCAELAADALRRGICVVVGLWEANLAAAAREVLATGLGEAGEGGADDGEDFLSAPKMIMHVSGWLGAGLGN